MSIFHRPAHTMEAVLEKLGHVSSPEPEICKLHMQRALWNEQNMKQLEVVATEEALSSHFTIRGYVAQFCKRDKGLTNPFSSMPSMEQLISIEVLLPLTCAPSHAMPLDIREQRLATYESTGSIIHPLNADLRLHFNLGEGTKTIEFDSETGGQIQTVDATESDPSVVEATKAKSGQLVVSIGSNVEKASANDGTLNNKEALGIGSETALEQSQFTVDLPVKAPDDSGSSYELSNELKKTMYSYNLEAEGILQKEQPEDSILSGINNNSLAAMQCAEKFSLDGKEVLNESTCIIQGPPSECGEISLDGFEDTIKAGVVCNLKVPKNTIVQVDLDHDSSISQMSLAVCETAVVGRESVSVSVGNSSFDFNEKEHIEPCVDEILEQLKPKCKGKRMRLLSEIIQSGPQTEVAGIVDSGVWSSEEIFASLALRNLPGRVCDKRQMGSVRSSDIGSTLYREAVYKDDKGDTLVLEKHEVEVQSKDPAVKHISSRPRMKRKCVYDSLGKNKRSLISRKFSCSKFISEPKKGFELHLSDSSSCSDSEKNISRAEQSKNYVYKIFQEYSKAELSFIDQPNKLQVLAPVELSTSTTSNIENGRLLNRRNEVDCEHDNGKEMVTSSEISRSKTFIAHTDTQGTGHQSSNVPMQILPHEQPQSLTYGKDNAMKGCKIRSSMTHPFIRLEMQPEKSLTTSACGTHGTIIDMVETYGFSDREPARECEDSVKDNQKRESKNQGKSKLLAVIQERQSLANDDMKVDPGRPPDCSSSPRLRQTTACITTVESNITQALNQSTTGTGAEHANSISVSIPLEGTRISHKRLKSIARQGSQYKFSASSPKKLASKVVKKRSKRPQTFKRKVVTNVQQSVFDGLPRPPSASHRGLPSGRYSFVGKTLYRQLSHRKSQCPNAVTPIAEIASCNRLELASSKDVSARDPSEASQICKLGGQIMTSCQVGQSETKHHSYTDKQTQSIVCSFPALNSGSSSELTHICCVPGCCSKISKNKHIDVPDNAISSNALGLPPTRDDTVSTMAASSTEKSSLHIRCTSSFNAHSLIAKGNSKESANSLKGRAIRNQVSPILQSATKGLTTPKICVAHKPPSKSTVGIVCHQNESDLKTDISRSTELSQSSPLSTFYKPQCSFAQNSSAALHVQPNDGFVSKSHDTSEASNACSTVSNTCCISNERGMQSQESLGSAFPSSLFKSIGHMSVTGDCALESVNMSPNFAITSGSTSAADFWRHIQNQFNTPQSGSCCTLVRPAIIRKRKVTLTPSCIAGKKDVTIANRQTVGSSSTEASALGSEKG